MVNILKYIVAFLGIFFLANMAIISFTYITQTSIEQPLILDNSTNAIKNFSSLFPNESSTVKIDQTTPSSYITTIDQIKTGTEINDNVNVTTRSESANPYSGNFEKNNIQSKTNNLTTDDIVDTGITQASYNSAVLSKTTYSNLNKKMTDNNNVNIEENNDKIKKTTKTTTINTKSSKFNSVKINNKGGSNNTTIMPKIVLQTLQNEYKYNLKSKQFFRCDFKSKFFNNLPTLYAHLVGNKSYDNHLIYYFDEYFVHDKVIHIEDNYIQHRINQIKFQINENASIFYNEHAALVINELWEVSYIDYGDQNREEKISFIYNYIRETYSERCIQELHLILRIIHYFPQLILFNVYQKHLDDCQKDKNSKMSHRAPTVLLMLETQKYFVWRKFFIKQNKIKN